MDKEKKENVVFISAILSLISATIALMFLWDNEKFKKMSNEIKIKAKKMAEKIKEKIKKFKKNSKNKKQQDN